jgi:hypothetical protein
MRNLSTLRTLAATAGVLVLTACGSVGPPTSQPVDPPTEHGFATKQIALPFGGDGFGLPGACGFGLPNVCGPIGPGFGPIGCGFGPVPVAGDIFGGTTFFTGRNGLDRQPASLPCGIAEENDVAFRPLGSAIWQPK